jgi:hypothetical protein
MSLTREDYARVCEIARTLSWELRRRPRLQALAVELHDMAEGVIGQQMPPVARPRTVCEHGTLPGSSCCAKSENWPG